MKLNPIIIKISKDQIKSLSEGEEDFYKKKLKKAGVPFIGENVDLAKGIFLTHEDYSTEEYVYTFIPNKSSKITVKRKLKICKN